MAWVDHRIAEHGATLAGLAVHLGLPAHRLRRRYAEAGYVSGQAGGRRPGIDWKIIQATYADEVFDWDKLDYLMGRGMGFREAARKCGSWLDGVQMNFLYTRWMRDGDNRVGKWGNQILTEGMLRRASKLIVEERKTMAEAASIIGCKKGTLEKRLNKRGVHVKRTYPKPKDLRALAALRQRQTREEARAEGIPPPSQPHTRLMVEATYAALNHRNDTRGLAFLDNVIGAIVRSAKENWLDKNDRRPENPDAGRE